MALSFPLSTAHPMNRFLLASVFLLLCLFLLSALFLPCRSPPSPFSLSSDLSLPPPPSPSPSPSPPPLPSLYHPPPPPPPGHSLSETGPADAAAPREVGDGITSVEREAAPDRDATEAREGRPVGRREEKCDIYQGRWERDEEGWYPLYSPGSCPYVDEAFSCQENGRPDRDYLKWRWKPKDCDLPR